MPPIVGYVVLLLLASLFAVLWRRAEEARAHLASEELDYKQARYSLQRAHDALEDELGRVREERELLLRASVEQAAKVADLEAEGAGLRDDVATLRESLLVSEKRRLDVGSIIGRVIHEKNVWRSIYQSLRQTAANAQSKLWGEIAVLSKRLNKSISPDVVKVAKAAEAVYTQPLPRPPSDEAYVQAIQVAHEGGGVQLPPILPPEDAAPGKPGPEAA